MLQETFDYVILGTGLVQSLLAGALGMQGKRVIHIDRNQFYGEYMSSYTLEDFPTPSVQCRPRPKDVVVEEATSTVRVGIPTTPMPQLHICETTPNNIGRQKAKMEAMEKCPVGTVVDAGPFGVGFVADYNDHGSAKIILDWSLAQYGTRRTNLASVLASMPLCASSRAFWAASIALSLSVFFSR